MPDIRKFAKGSKHRKLPVLQSHRGCTDCDLGSRQDLKNGGLPGRAWDEAPAKVSFGVAVLMVGAYPGVEEDKTGRIFSGKTGVYMNQLYVRGSAIHELADVYLTNAVRCAPRDTITVTTGMLKTCRKYLEEDIHALADAYAEVVVVACGAEAITSILGKSRAIGVFPQGSVVDFGDVKCRVFGTYLPAILLPGRDPAKRTAIFDHMMIVRRYLETGHTTEPPDIDEIIARTGDREPPKDCQLISLDIETYGAVEGYPDQTVFCPAKSTAVDGVSPDQTILTTAIAWKEGDQIYGRAFKFNTQYQDLLRILWSIDNLTIIGHNIPFDVQYLRASTRGFHRVLNFDHCKLINTAVTNFLASDQRPERGLKNISTVLGVDDYSSEEVSLRKGERYSSVDDPRLYHYNVRDCVATLLIYESHLRQMRTTYGAETAKWSPECQEWYNTLSWMLIDFQEQGIQYDEKKLRRLHEQYEARITHNAYVTERQWGLVVGGKGSQGSIREAFQLAFDACQQEPNIGDLNDRVEFTNKGGFVSTSAKNMKLFMGILPKKSKIRPRLEAIRTHRTLQKITSTYSGPLLGVDPDDRRGALVSGRAYPSWFIVPSWVTDASGEGGGTQQGRITSKYPPTQTQPEDIEMLQVSRYGKRGCIVRADESQIELRVPAALSGDPVMIEIFRQGINLHQKTASWLVGFDVDKKVHKSEYHAGKTANFLRIFGGSAFKLRATVLDEVGLELPLSRCEEFIEQDRSEYHVMYAWQEELVTLAKERGYLELPVTGISRTFLGDIEATYRSTILNFPVQTLAAKVTLSAQMEVWKRLRVSHPKILTVSNTYDEGIYDCPCGSEKSLAKLLKSVYTRPPIWEHLISTGYIVDVPLAVEVKAYYADGRVTEL